VKKGWNAKGEKRCCRCGDFKDPKKFFSRNKALADGFAAMCRDCRRKSDKEAKRPKGEKPPTEVSDDRGDSLTLAPARAEEKPDEPQAPPMRPPPRGPASSITPAIIESLSETLSRGHTRRVAALRAGVDEDTLAKWMQRGKEEQNPDAPTRRVYDAVKAAEAHGEFRFAELAFQDAAIDPRSAMRVLERRYGKEWARRQELTLNDGDDDKPEVENVRAQLREKLLKLGAATLTVAAAAAGESDRVVDARAPAGEAAGGPAGGG